MSKFSLGFIQKPSTGELFPWDAENDDAVPGSATYTRASLGWYRNDSGDWVEASSGEIRSGHNLTPGGGEKGYLPEPAATKLALFPRDFTNGAWSPTNITAAKDATGIDAVANAASTLTADAANGTILQSFTRASSAHTFSVFVARKTGTGTIEITVDGGTTWVDITSSISSDIRDDPYKVTQTLANPSIGFRIGTSGDEIEVDMGDLEATPYVTTPLDHTSGTATRVADRLAAGVSPSAAGYTAFVDATAVSDPDDANTCIGHTDAKRDSYCNTSDGSIRANVEGTNFNMSGTDWRGVRLKVSMSNPNVAATTGYLSATGETTDDRTVNGTFTAEWIIGGRDTDRQWRGVIHNVQITEGAVSQAANEALVA